MEPADRASRRTNLALLALVPLAALTGLVANAIGGTPFIGPATVHGVVALAVALLAPWKAPIVRRGLALRRRSRWGSILLLGLLAVTLLSGLLHSTGATSRIGPLTIMQVHVGGATLALVMTALHYRAHALRPRPADLDRRMFLKLAGLGSAGVTAWLGWEGALRVAGAAGSHRRFTGSHERGSFDPAAMPVTAWFNDQVPRLDAAMWTIRIDGAEFGLPDLAAAGPEDVTAILDCTSGWYSEQVWSGVPLGSLIRPGEARSVLVRSVTGYSRRFPVTDLDAVWLVTDMGGNPLSAGHGFPARIVAPGRRGFWWVKWVAEIRRSAAPWWWQPPFPLT